MELKRRKRHAKHNPVMTVYPNVQYVTTKHSYVVILTFPKVKREQISVMMNYGSFIVSAKLSDDNEFIYERHFVVRARDGAQSGNVTIHGNQIRITLPKDRIQLLPSSERIHF